MCELNNIFIRILQYIYMRPKNIYSMCAKKKKLFRVRYSARIGAGFGGMPSHYFCGIPMAIPLLTSPSQLIQTCGLVGLL